MMADLPFPAHTVTKTVPMKFMGIDLSFKLSHALFSGFKIDDGTMLLLKTLAQQKAIPESGRVLDSGCGVGPLAVAIKKRFPGLEMHAGDRFALACAFTMENARCNGVSVHATPSLLMEGPGGLFDLIVSNLPAKAGAPVLAAALVDAGNLLTPGGRVAIVVVTPLAEWVRTTLDGIGAEIIWQEDSHDYRVIHYCLGHADRSSQTVTLDQSLALPEAYRRGSMSWEAGTGTIIQNTSWGLPNFDSLDYRLEVTLDLFGEAQWKSPILVWEPGQGHISSALATIMKAAPGLAGNDWLALRTARSNLIQLGFSPVPDHPVATIGHLTTFPEGSFNGAIINLHTEPKIKWTAETCNAINHLVQPGGQVIITGSSTDLARFLANHHGLAVIRDTKYRGWRAVLFERNKIRSKP